MKLAAIYDIHGNLPALEVVLREIAQAHVDQVVVGGDVVPGPMCSEALAALANLDIPVRCIRGNCESAMLAQINGIEPPGLPEAVQTAMRWVGRQLTAEQIAWISGWPLTITLPTGIGDVLFCHATPRDDNEIFTRLTPEEQLSPAFAGVETSTIVCGHTHMQFDRSVGGLRVVNAGSVGMPFGNSGAYWLLIGSQIDFRRAAYDLNDAALRIRSVGHPQAKEFAEKWLLHPPSEDDMLKVYAKAEIGSQTVARGR